MDIKNYTAFFHDGGIIAIHHTEDAIVMPMESAEMDEEDVKDDLILSKDNNMLIIRGKLHIERIKSIKENKQPYLGILKMKNEDAGIFHFDLDQNKVELQIIWSSYPPNHALEGFSTIEIKAEKIWWENIPDMPCPT